MLPLSKLNAFADDSFSESKTVQFFFGKVENDEKRTKCWLPAFSLFPTMFSKHFFQGALNVNIVW